MKRSKRAREKWAQYHRHMRIEEVDGIDGVRFERFVKTLLERSHYGNVQTTPRSGDKAPILSANRQKENG